MPAPHTLAQVLTWYQHENAHPSRDWTNYCQMSVRTAWGIPSLFASAWAQWLGADPEDKHAGGKPEDAPIGAALLWKGSSPYGHIATHANPFPNGAAAIWSNDLVRRGHLDKAAASAPVTEWHQGYLGYLTAVNDWDLNLAEARKAPVTARPKPKQTSKYAAIDRAVHKLGVALDTAKAQHDAADVKTLEAEVARLQHLYATLRRK